jgi:ATP-dependent DNA ligase
MPSTTRLRRGSDDAFPVMEARSVETLPHGSDWLYEPKWDGFRCLLLRGSSGVRMLSKSGQNLTRYFPEIASAAARLPDGTFVLDGEIVVPIGETFSFDHLLQRIHPAESRIRQLSEMTPALFIAFDLLRRHGKDLRSRPLAERRVLLEDFAAHCFAASPRFRLSPKSTSRAQANRWLISAGEGSDGLIAKRLDLPYQSGNREGMQKIKLCRSADCVIGGYRYAERKMHGHNVVGSLLLGLYDDEGLLHHVGFSSGIKERDKPALTSKLESLLTERSFTGATPGGPSRWSTKRSTAWKPVRPKLVVEISYDHFSNGRFRHGTSILRWRPDKKPAQCRVDQLQQKSAAAASLLVDTGLRRTRARRSTKRTGVVSA